MSYLDLIPASLLIFKYHFSCTKKNYVFNAVNTSFKFNYEPINKPNKAPPSNALLNVIAFVPFRLIERFDILAFKIRRKLVVEVKAGLNLLIGTINSSVSTENEETYKQKYFGEG